ncbi:hypothetical protein Pla52n_34530 [Stieleria varia]|uniref:Uncharacterized protein n=1 Tax=Stieleria varia TaxID=2528005 RepID=A0A5C6AQT5_9BACT|nr:hypothetical protein Pla52n_34530 [Stieleria varia]
MEQKHGLKKQCQHQTLSSPALPPPSHSPERLFSTSRKFFGGGVRNGARHKAYDLCLSGGWCSFSTWKVERQSLLVNAVDNARRFGNAWRTLPLPKPGSINGAAYVSGDPACNRQKHDQYRRDNPQADDELNPRSHRDIELRSFRRGSQSIADSDHQQQQHDAGSDVRKVDIQVENSERRSSREQC